MVVIDARGFSCPIPVVRTKEAIDANPKTPLAVLVESEVSRENVSRLAASRGYSVKVERIEDGFRLMLSPPAS
jgi:tRNA 2-thiouridine synthesizing protein A